MPPTLDTRKVKTQKYMIGFLYNPPHRTANLCVDNVRIRQANFAYKMKYNAAKGTTIQSRTLFMFADSRLLACV